MLFLKEITKKHLYKFNLHNDIELNKYDKILKSFIKHKNMRYDIVTNSYDVCYERYYQKNGFEYCAEYSISFYLADEITNIGCISIITHIF